MALDPLATIGDLAARGITSDDPTTLTALLEAASEAVRAAAGVPISRETATVTIWGTSGQYLVLPGRPIVSVENVRIDGTEVTDWKLVGDRLWRRDGWCRNRAEPSNVTLTITSGFAEVPADIVDLVCAMVGSAVVQATESGYQTRAGVAYESVDDYRIGYTQDGSAPATPMELPKATRAMLRSRFGGSVTVVGAQP